MPTETTGLSAEDCAGYLRAMATERRRIGDPSYVGLNASELEQAADVIECLSAERNRYESPAWKANNLLNGRVEICYHALERISKIHPNAGTTGDIAREALEAAANVQ